MTEKEEKLQKLYMEFQMLDQHIKQLEKQNTALNNQLMELTVTNQSLEDIKRRLLMGSRTSSTLKIAKNEPLLLPMTETWPKS